MGKVFVIAGPTGVGKTEFSIKFAKAINGEIINGDAYQIYKELNVGTAKISEEEMDGVIHHLFNLYNFNEECSVASYQKLARDKIAEVFSKGKVPIIVGGSGYYLKTILYDYKFKTVEQVDYSNYTNEELYAMLQAINPEWASNLHVNNRIRVERALQAGGIVEPVGDMIYDTVIFGITMERELLYKRINERVDKMIAEGLVEEIESLLACGANFEMQSMKAIGYKEFVDYFNGEMPFDTVVELVKRNSRRYAKKQYTWFRNQMDVVWVTKEETQDIERFLDNYQTLL